MSEFRFDVEAKLPTEASSSSVNEMLQALLKDRFALGTHRETRDVPGLALVVGKHGARLTPTKQEPSPPAAVEVMGKLDRLAGQQRSAAVGVWYQNDATTPEIAQAVSRMIRTPVVDQTSLGGKYEVSLDLPPPESPDDPLEFRVKQALAKLGLGLERCKVPVEILVIDAALKVPKEN